ncbi:hypothetical protein JCM10908_000068 [Rhodotorula pacifica]|uniref:MDR family MFS transporter n=1 Tax=Rhodotorula pacifica TaxID=1495444 RepID=UPI003170E4A6
MTDGALRDQEDDVKKDCKDVEEDERAGDVGMGEILDKEGKLHPTGAATSSSNNDDRQPPTGFKLFLLLIALLLVEVLVGLDNTIVATSTATIANDFKALADVGWYGSAYLLTTVSLQPLFGRAYAFFPQKWVFLFALVIFEVGCIVAAVAQSSPVLILGRAIQGTGYAGLFIGILQICANALSVRTQAMVTSLMNVSYGFGTVLGCSGPLVGGAITSNLQWRWIFWIMLPPGGLAMALVVLLCHPPPIPQTLSVRRRLLHMDWIGAILLLGSMVCLLIALQRGGISWAWVSSRMIGLLVGFFALTAAFFVLQAFLGERSSISLRLMRDRSLAAVCFVNFTCGASYYALLYYIPIYFQAVTASSPVRAGIQLLPLIFFNMTFGILAGWTVSRFGVFHPAMWVGTGLTALGAGLHATLNQYSGAGEWIVFGMIVGAGMGALYMMSFVASQMLLHDPADKSRAASLVCFFQIWGATAWVSVSNSIYSNQFKRGISRIPGVDVQAVLDSGVDRFREVVTEEQLKPVTDVAVSSLFDVFLASAMLGTAGFIAVFAVRWVNIGSSKQNKAKEGDEKEEIALGSTPTERPDSPA